MVLASTAPVWFQPVGIPLASWNSNPGLSRMTGSAVGLGTSLRGISEAEASGSGVVDIGRGSNVRLAAFDPERIPVSWGSISELVPGRVVGVHPTTMLKISKIATQVIHSGGPFRSMFLCPF